MQVRAANACRGDLDDHVPGILELRIRDRIHSYVAMSVPTECFHELSRGNCRACSLGAIRAPPLLRIELLGIAVAVAVAVANARARSMLALIEDCRILVRLESAAFRIVARPGLVGLLLRNALPSLGVHG